MKKISNKEEIIKMMENEAIFTAKHIPNFGTTSMSKPIKKGLPDTIFYDLDIHSVHHATAKSLINSGKVIVEKRERVGMSNKITYKLSLNISI